MMRGTRSVSWVGAARKGFEAFPQGVRLKLARALCLVAEGRRPDIAKPLDGSGPGVLELTLHHRGDAFRVVCAVRIGADVWVIHAFQEKSGTGVGTPQAEIDPVHERPRRPKETPR
jgi:phage-related protein